MKQVQFFKESVTSFCFSLRLVNSVHFVCQNEAQNEMNGTKEPASGLKFSPVGRVQVLDDLAEIVGHALQLRVERLRELVGALPLRVWRRSRRQGRLERPQEILELGLLPLDEVQLVLQSLERVAQFD